MKKLLGWISMMKLKSRLMLIETTDSTLPSGLVNKLTLD